MAITYREHQRAAIEDVLPKHERFCLFWEMGTGKTIPMLVHLDNLIASGEVKTALWVGPVTAYDVVEKNISLLPERRQERLRKALTVINYDKLSRTSSKTANDIALKNWDCIILDEAHKIARPQSNRTQYFVGAGKRTKGMAYRAKYRYLLTGTPINNSRYQDLWSYMRFLWDEDYMTYAEFKTRYLKMRTYPPGTYNQIICGYTKHIDELKQSISEHAQYIATEECLDLPGQLPDELITVPWRSGKNATGAKTEQMYLEALQSYVDSLDMVMDNPLVRMTKLRQIASGHIRDDEGTTHALQSFKADYCVDLIESAGSKTVVFFDFRQTREAIAKALDKAAIKYITLDGDQKDKSIWKQFQSDEKIQVILVHYQSGSESIDLFAAHTTIFAEPCMSYTVMEQARARTYRNGQTHKCSYYYLLTEDSIDFDIYARLQGHEDFSEKFYRDIAIARLSGGRK